MTDLMVMNQPFGAHGVGGQDVDDLRVYVHAKSEKSFSFGLPYYLRSLRQVVFHKVECLLPLGQAQ